MAETGQRRRHVLVVEDDPAIAELIRQVVSELPGVEVQVAYAGREALDAALLKDQRLDLLILDLRLPQVSGEDLIRALRRHGLRPAVLIVSAGAEPVVHQAARRVNAYAVVGKPFDLGDLSEKVRQGLELAGRNSAGPKRTSPHDSISVATGGGS